MEIPNFSFFFPSFGVNYKRFPSNRASDRKPDNIAHLTSDSNVKLSSKSQKIVDSYVFAFQKNAKLIEQDLLHADVLVDLLEKVDRNIKTIDEEEGIKDMQKNMQGTFLLLENHVTQIAGKVKGLRIATETSKMLPGCGEGSNAHQCRMGITGGLKDVFLKLLNRLLEFQQEMQTTFKNSVDKSLNTVPRMKSDLEEIDTLIETRESEEIRSPVSHQKAFQEIMDRMEEQHEIFLNLPTIDVKKIIIEGEFTQNPGEESTWEGEQMLFNQKADEELKLKRQQLRQCSRSCCLTFRYWL